MYDEKIPVQIPQTLEELQSFVTAHQIPLQKIHMHLGENYSGPKAYGIYQEGSDFIVYKNKSDGSRAIRYRGTDEAYAVNEIYQKIREMGIAAKAAETGTSHDSNGFSDAGDNSSDSDSSVEDTRKPGVFSGIKKRLLSGEVIITIAILFFALPSIFEVLSPKRRTPKYQEGYYNYCDNYYYSDGYDWYIFFDDIWSLIGSDTVNAIISDYSAYSVNIYEEGIEACTISYDNDQSDRNSRWDDDDWADDNDWDFDFDSDWDWDSDW